MKKVLFAILTIVIFAISVQMTFSSTKLDGYSRISLTRILNIDFKSESPEVLATIKPDYPVIEHNSRLFVDMFIMADGNDRAFLLDRGCIIRSEVDNIIAVYIPIEKLSEVLSVPNVIKAEAGRIVYRQMDKSRVDIFADEVHSGLDLPQGYDGTGVIVGVVDTGIDFTNPDFSGDNGSRILYLWDMADVSGEGNPDGYTWGREYTKADIDNNPEMIGEEDGNGGSGHGTHVTGTAAGSGKNNPNMKGIAPNADIIFVKALRTQDSEGSFSSTDIVAACQYIFKKANELGKPAVINMSLGSPIGSHDGTSLNELAISQMITNGKLIVVAAGNNGNMPIHAGAEVNPDDVIESLLIPVNLCDLFPDFCPKIPNLYMTAADIWADESMFDSVAVGLYDASNPFEPVFMTELAIAGGEAIENAALALDDKVFGYVSIDAMTTSAPNNKSSNVFLTISNGGNTEIVIDDYIWALRFVCSKKGRLDLWAGLPVPQSYPINGTRGKQIKGDVLMTISNYASCQKVISAASYVTRNSWIDIDDMERSSGGNIGERSAFSSIGPTRDGRLAPTIGAPGQMIFSSKSSHLDEGIGYNRTSLIQGDNYIGMQGTSMASPHVAGVVALMLQAKPNLGFETIVLHFSETARHDEYTGGSPNVMFGLGKIDAYRAVRTAVTDVEDPSVKYFRLFPNPASKFVTFEFSQDYYDPQFELFNSYGSRVMTHNNILSSGQFGKGYLIFDVQSLATGLYVLKVKAGSEIITIPLHIIK